jgi:hypothetical protein
MAEGAFWKKYGVDPHLLALVLFALWDQGVSDRYVVEDVLAMHRLAKERAENAVLATTPTPGNLPSSNVARIGAYVEK